MAQLRSLSKRLTRQRLPKTHRLVLPLKRPSKPSLSSLPRQRKPPNKPRPSSLPNRRRQLKYRRLRKQLKRPLSPNLPRQRKQPRLSKPLRPQRFRPSNRLRPSLLLPKRPNRTPPRPLLRCKLPRLNRHRKPKWPIRHRPMPRHSLTNNRLLLLIWPLPSRQPTRLTRPLKPPRLRLSAKAPIPALVGTEAVVVVTDAPVAKRSDLQIYLIFFTNVFLGNGLSGPFILTNVKKPLFFSEMLSISNHTHVNPFLKNIFLKFCYTRIIHALTFFP